MVDLMVDTEFIKVGKDRYINKLGNGQVYSKKELMKLIKKNNEELYGIKSETVEADKRHKSTKYTRD